MCDVGATLAMKGAKLRIREERDGVRVWRIKGVSVSVGLGTTMCVCGRVCGWTAAGWMDHG